jgi:rsbT co-antagonist protein RsbR
LRESEEQLRLYIRQSPVAVAMLDSEMHYLVASDRWMEDFRLGPESVVGRSHYDLFPDLPQRWLDVHRKVHEAGLRSSATMMFAPSAASARPAW